MLVGWSRLKYLNYSQMEWQTFDTDINGSHMMYIITYNFGAPLAAPLTPP